MLDKYCNEQVVSTILLKKALENNKLVQAYLLCHSDINYLFEYARCFSIDIITGNNKNEKISNDILNDVYPEFKVICPDGSFIKKEQLENLQKDVKTKPLLGEKIVYIIKECDKLNASSANSILKFLEEPADDIIAILLTDNLNNVLPTIVSRCQIINLNNTKKNNNLNTNELIRELINKYNIEEIDELIENTLEFIKNIESKKINTFIYVKKLLWEKYQERDDIASLFNLLIYFYMDVLYFKNDSDIKYFYDYNDDISNVSELNTEDEIIKKIYLFENLKNELKFNVNSKLIFDKLVIELGENICKKNM